jgi:hypothetical protein
MGSALAILPQPESIARVRFQDGPAILGQVTTTAMGFPPPPAGKQYEVWLLGGEQRRSMGILPVDANGQGTLAFVDPEGRNLLGLFGAVEFTLEPDPDANPNPSGQIAFSGTLPPLALSHIRHLLVSFSGAPDQIALIQGLYRDAKQIDETLQIMLASYQGGDEASIRMQAEGVVNILVGNRSDDYRDWNEDGQVTDFSDGFGFLLNGDQTGYIVAVTSLAGLAASAPDASENISMHASHVQIATQNIEQWTPELRDLMIELQSSSAFGPDTEALLRQAGVLSGRILNGIDLNGNELIEPIPGEGGVQTAYEHACYMADISIFAVGQ